jgi:AcrR family transcriptional regulator
MTEIDLNKTVRSARKPKGDGHERRGEILEAATRIFNSEGYDGATIRRIAEEVGLSSTALYMHFRDKDEILVEICESAMEALLGLASEIAARPVAAEERARAMIAAYVQFGLTEPSTYRLVFCSQGRHMSPQSQALVERLGDRCFGYLVGAAAEIAAHGRLRSASPEAAAQVMWAAGHGLTSLLITQPDRSWAPTGELTRTLLDGIFEGLISG